jgi:Arc/MetJ-type ribon-helix-helix transcriptional regulator
MTRAIRRPDLTAQVVVRVPVGLRDRIELAAAADRRRSTSEFIRNIIEDALEHRSDGPAGREVRA